MRIVGIFFGLALYGLASAQEAKTMNESAPGDSAKAKPAETAKPKAGAATSAESDGDAAGKEAAGPIKPEDVGANPSPADPAPKPDPAAPDAPTEIDRLREKANIAVVPAMRDTQVIELVQDTARPPASAPAPAAAAGGIPVINNALANVVLGGRLQFKGFYHDFLAEQDQDKALSFQLRRLSLDVDGRFAGPFGFKLETYLDANNRLANLNQAYAYYEWNEFWSLRAGKLKRPISQEVLQSSKRLYTIERGELYYDFLAKTTGYIDKDIGMVFSGGFRDDNIPVGYELGLFNGKNPLPTEDFSDQHLEKTDRGFLAKDVVLRAHARPFPVLFVEGAVSTKGGEDRSDPGTFEYRMNVAYQAGLDFHYRAFRLLGEVAWGDNHQGRNDFIGVDTLSTSFFAFYATGVWRNEYAGERASELVAKVQGLDPAAGFGGREDVKNDSFLRYYLGGNYFFNPFNSVQLGYGILQPITQVEGEDALHHDLEAMWRMYF